MSGSPKAVNVGVWSVLGIQDWVLKSYYALCISKNVHEWHSYSLKFQSRQAANIAQIITGYLYRIPTLNVSLCENLAYIVAQLDMY